MSKGVLTPDNEDFGFTKVCISKRKTKLASPQVLSGKLACFKDIDVILEYVKLHADILLRHWFGEIDDLELYLGLSMKR